MCFIKTLFFGVDTFTRAMFGCGSFVETSTLSISSIFAMVQIGSFVETCLYGFNTSAQVMFHCKHVSSSLIRSSTLWV